MLKIKLAMCLSKAGENYPVSEIFISIHICLEKQGFQMEKQFTLNKASQ